MSSPAAIPLRRRRGAVESDDEDEIEYARSVSKRRPNPQEQYPPNGNADSDDEDEEEQGEGDISSGEDSGTLLPESYHSNPLQNGFTSTQMANGELPVSAEGFQPGAIVRVKATNFVTYEDVEFHPGPNLNMVIGPNGTGKSSLVCAICLGLGYSPKHLGRADNVGEFVKHGRDEAIVETELQRAPGQRINPVIQLRIIRDGDRRKWKLNGQDASLKAVQQLTKQYGIMIDNLCQFLPQDRVSEFAGLTPVELLNETQRAAAPEQMLEWHSQLKQLWKDQQAIKIDFDGREERLQNLETRQEGLQGQVERYEARQEVEQQLKLMENVVHFIRYRSAQMQHRQAKRDAKLARTHLKDLEQRAAPALQAVNAKQVYAKKLEAAVRERQQAVKIAITEADKMVTRIEGFGDKITSKEAELNAEVEGNKRRTKDLQAIINKIRDLEKKLEEPAPEFDAPAFNARIREKDAEEKALMRQIGDQKNTLRNLITEVNELRAEGERYQEERRALDSHAGKQQSKLRQISPHTQAAWEYVTQNRDQFEQPVLGPPILECSIKDPRYIDQLETILGREDMIVITAQTRKDFLTLSNMFGKKSNMADVTIKQNSARLADFNPPMSREEMQRLGFEKWALDVIDGPEPILASLCSGNQKLHRVGLTLREVTDEQYNNILAHDSISSFVSGKTLYRVTRRREYNASNTTTRSVRPARNFTDEPVDDGSKTILTTKIREIEEKISEAKDRSVQLKADIQELTKRKDQITAEIENLKEEKSTLQRALGIYSALPTKIARENDTLEEKKRLKAEAQKRMRDLMDQIDGLAIEKAECVCRYQQQVAVLREAHQELEEVLLRKMEAEFDVTALSEKNAEIKQKVEDEKKAYEQAVERAVTKKEEARKFVKTVERILTNAEPTEREFYSNYDTEGMTEEQWKIAYDAEAAKLEFMDPGDPNVVNEFERRRAEIESLKNNISLRREELESSQRKIQEIRRKWEPELNKLVQEISDAFAYNFEQIGCAGEVALAKPEEYDQWAIEIKVKFRQSEQLQQLDQHRQSGGERSVSTIFYLMSLQSLARAPFRVVDEINQGMDPRNERMVHERMVEIACKEHTSQYFLITPKLLTGLRYDQRMKVLCIASGEYMPSDYRQLDVREVVKMKRAMIAAR